MKICCIADTQGAEWRIPLDQMPNADMLLIGGDLTCYGTIKELELYNEWLGTDTLKSKYRYRVIVAGNHDTELKRGIGHLLFTNAIYLENEFVQIEGLKIYGSPINEINISGDWAFADHLEEQASKIPEGLDILLTHGPPYGILDQLAPYNQNIGNVFLRDQVKKVKPRYMIFGHLHEAYGQYQDEHTTYLNVAMQDEHGRMFVEGNKLIHPPVVIEL